MISFLPAAAQPAARELLMTPARRIILLLGVPLSLTLLAWTCFGIISKASQGSYTVSYSPVRVSGGLAMNVYGGDVTLQGGVAPSAAQFTGAGTVWYGLTYSGQRPTLATAQTAAGTRINFACPDFNCALSSTVDVPPQVPVTVTSNGGNVTATGISDATLQTGGGNLTVEGLTGDVSLNTDGSQNGGPFGGGNVAGTLAAQNVTVDSGGSSVDLQLSTPPSNLNVTTEGGNVTLQLPGGYSYRVDNIPETEAQIEQNGPPQPSAITVTTSSSSQYRITVNADGGAVTID
jgi:VCBS repeat-containing protein